MNKKKILIILIVIMFIVLNLFFTLFKFKSLNSLGVYYALFNVILTPRNYVEVNSFMPKEKVVFINPNKYTIGEYFEQEGYHEITEMRLGSLYMFTNGKEELDVCMEHFNKYYAEYSISFNDSIEVKTDNEISNTTICGVVKSIDDKTIQLTKSLELFYWYTRTDYIAYSENHEISEYEEVLIGKNEDIEIMNYDSTEKIDYKDIEEGDVLIVTGNLNLMMVPKEIKVLKKADYVEKGFQTLVNYENVKKKIIAVNEREVVLKYEYKTKNAEILPFVVKFDLPENSNISENDINKCVNLEFTKNSIDIMDAKNGNLYLKSIEVIENILDK